MLIKTGFLPPVIFMGVGALTDCLLYTSVDAFDKGSYVKILPEQNRIIGYTTRNSGGVPENFKNYFVIEFDLSLIHI